jgi:hypothetical protein
MGGTSHLPIDKEALVERGEFIVLVASWQATSTMNSGFYGLPKVVGPR